MCELCNEHAQCVNFPGATMTINRLGHGKLPTYMMVIGLQLSSFGLGKTEKSDFRADFRRCKNNQKQLQLGLEIKLN